MRIKQNRVHLLEKRNNKYVKEFSRCAAGKELPDARDLRPSNVLLQTMDYLVQEILQLTDGDEYTSAEVYDFVNDRINAIRQDMTIQRIDDDNAILILERATRFYLLSSYTLCEEPIETFDMHLNNEQLFVCLRRAIELKRKKGFSCKNSEEFLCIYSALSVGSVRTVQELLVQRGKLPRKILDDVIRLHVAFVTGNFIQYFKIVTELPVSVRLAAHQQFQQVRHQALRMMCSAYSSMNCKFPISVLSDWLKVPEKIGSKLCGYYGLKVIDGAVIFKKSDFAWDLGRQKPIIEDMLFEDLKSLSYRKFIYG